MRENLSVIWLAVILLTYQIREFNRTKSKLMFVAIFFTALIIILSAIEVSGILTK